MALDGNLQRAPRSSLISDSLLERINAGEFLPGKKLPSEQQLQEQYDVSRPVVREAVKALAAQGVVVVESGHGAVVQEVNDKMLRTFFKRALTADVNSRIHLMQLRAVLERYSVSRAAVCRTDEQLERIEDTLLRMRNAQGNFDDYSRHDVHFHIELAEATKVETARSTVYRAARQNMAGEDPRQLASIAKYYTSEICEDVCSDAIQIHGGYGYTRDFPVEKFYRDSRVQKIVEGTSQIQKNIIYDSITPGDL